MRKGCMRILVGPRFSNHMGFCATLQQKRSKAVLDPLNCNAKKLAHSKIVSHLLMAGDSARKTVSVPNKPDKLVAVVACLDFF